LPPLAQGTKRVSIPFDEDIAALIPPVALRLRRDNDVVRGLVEAHALLHQKNRKRGKKTGAVIAALRDYEAVHALIADLFAEGVEATVSEIIRQTVQAVDSLSHKTSGGVSVASVAKLLDLHKSTITRRVEKAIDGGYLCNKATTKGRPAKLVVNDPLPEGIDMLPSADEVAAHYAARIKKLRRKLAQAKRTNSRNS
jgi:hypothetical protein